MNLDDESLLSAYLDDELDTADRLAVEWSVESSPPLADQLRSLATARDAVAGLGRPPIPGDLGPAILARLAADRRRARLQALARPGRVAMAVAGLSAMAASLLFALLQLHRSMHPTSESQAQVAQRPLVPDNRPNPISTPDRAPTSPPIPTFETPPPRIAEGEEARQRDDRRRIDEMLGRPNVHLILVTTDVIDAPEQIRDLIRKDARESAEFGRITLQAGIVIDRDRPDSAEVFVVPINEGGRPSFVNRLRGQFKDLEERRPSPDLVTQLTEVGHVALYEGTQASPQVDPPDRIRDLLALKPAGPGSESSPIDDHDTAPAELGSVVLESFVGPPRPTRRPNPAEPVTLLVWVTRPGRR